MILKKKMLALKKTYDAKFIKKKGMIHMNQIGFYHGIKKNVLNNKQVGCSECI